MPSAEISKVWISAESWAPGEWNPRDDAVDVIATLSDGSRWSATMCSFDHVAALREQAAESGECLQGRYVWAAGLILVADTSRPSVEAVLRDLLESGEFHAALASEPPA